MARRENELYIGTEYLNLEGRMIKHPSLIHEIANVNVNKVRETPIKLIGLDIETDHLKGDLKLLGIWDGIRYSYHTKDFLNVLLNYSRAAAKNDTALAYWNRLDPFVILKEFMNYVDDDHKQQALARFGKISGDWDKKTYEWIVEPVIQVKVGRYTFGIIQALRSSIQFFIHNEYKTGFKKVWSYDIAQLYQSGLEKEATSRFDYYSKVDKSAHLVDWQRFETDKDYKFKIVLKSNELDARACHDLGMSIQKEFNAAFGYYPRTLLSQGSIARSAIIANITNQYKHLDDKQATYSVSEDVKSIGIMNYYDVWTNKYGQEVMKDLYSLATEAYSGGYIEAIRYGYAKEGYYTDIASAYPGVIQHLYDLRNAKITKGKGTPPTIEHSYCFIRGNVNIPRSVNFHTITVKHVVEKSTNIRPSGLFRASYTLNERKFLEEQGATFENEEWYNIQTEGKPNTLAKVCKDFIDLRTKLIAEGNSAQYMAKIAANSLYGILFEAVDTYSEKTEKRVNTSKFYDSQLTPYLKKINLSTIKSEIEYWFGDLYLKVYNRWHSNTGLYPDQVKQELESVGIYFEADNSFDIFMEINKMYEYTIEESTQEHANVFRNGYRAGEFWNPILASIITSETRLTMARAATAIEKNGGKVIVMMTDSLFWTGKADMIPNELVREVKTLGYFEKVSKVYNIVCLGSGRYGYQDKDGSYTSKKRGLNAGVIQDEDGIDISDFNWLQALEIMAKTNKDKIDMQVRTLVSPGLILGNSAYGYHDLGRIVEEDREIDAIVGKHKRDYDPKLKNPKNLAKQLIETYPLYLQPNMAGRGIVDQTLPQLRHLMMHKNIITAEQRKRTKTADRQRSFMNADDKKIEHNKAQKRKYKLLKENGFTRDQASVMKNWSDERLAPYLKNLN
jgi:hypothetical protein